MRTTPSYISLLALFFVVLVCRQGSAQPPPELIKGFMIDAPRATESIDYYCRLIDYCSQRGLNSILFRLADDEGAAYRFRTESGLVFCDGAYTKEELQFLVRYAAARHIDMIPELESFGHAGYIVKSKKYAPLNDAPRGSTSYSLCPVNDSSVALMQKLLTEIATIFPAGYIHIGCDETNWGQGLKSAEALQTQAKEIVWSSYVNKLNRFVKKLGKRTIIWGDVPVYNDEKVFDFLDKDIVIAEWNYWESDRQKVERVAAKIQARGFAVIGCPAISWCKWGVRVGGEQFHNVSAYSSAYAGNDKAGRLGIILTNWVPQKYLQYSQWDSYEIAVNILQQKGSFDFSQQIRSLTENFFSASYDDDWGEIGALLYNAIPQSSCADADSLKFIPWNDSSQLRMLSEKQDQHYPFTRLKQLLVQKNSTVKKNKQVFNDIVLSMNFLQYLFERQALMNSLLQRGEVCNVATRFFLDSMARADKNYSDIMQAAWQKGRRGSFNHDARDYLHLFMGATAFSKMLAGNPALFRRYAGIKEGKCP